MDLLCQGFVWMSVSWSNCWLMKRALLMLTFCYLQDTMICINWQILLILNPMHIAHFVCLVFTIKCTSSSLHPPRISVFPLSLRMSCLVTRTPLIITVSSSRWFLRFLKKWTQSYAKNMGLDGSQKFGNVTLSGIMPSSLAKAWLSPPMSETVDKTLIPMASNWIIICINRNFGIFGGFFVPFGNFGSLGSFQASKSM